MFIKYNKHELGLYGARVFIPRVFKEFIDESEVTFVATHVVDTPRVFMY